MTDRKLSDRPNCDSRCIFIVIKSFILNHRDFSSDINSKSVNCQLDKSCFGNYLVKIFT